MDWHDLPDILTAQMIADHQHISRRRVYELLELSPEYGGIPCYSIGASKRVDKADYLLWIAKLKSKRG
jgi:hypothetical protein